MTETASGWNWQSGDTILDLPLPTLRASCQIENAAVAIAALHCLRNRVGWNPVALATGVRSANVSARLQQFTPSGAAEIIVDVAHNPQAARVLAQWLAANPVAGRTLAVFGALDDKDVAGIVMPLLPYVNCWILTALDGVSSRGLDAARLRDRVAAINPAAAEVVYADPTKALRNARQQAAANDRIIAFGSFYVAAAVLVAMHSVK
jgi:dihydrofolate synthase/folylpolyglutamate synthase